MHRALDCAKFHEIGYIIETKFLLRKDGSTHLCLLFLWYWQQKPATYIYTKYAFTQVYRVLVYTVHYICRQVLAFFSARLEQHPDQTLSVQVVLDVIKQGTLQWPRDRLKVCA